MTHLASFLQAVKLPIMPEVAHALIRTLNDEDADVSSVRSVIAKDPALTATLLRMANSAMFGLSRSVDTLDNAVSVVGLSQIRARALSICLANVFVLPPGMNRLEFWRSCMLCAGYARWLAAATAIDEQQAWLTGMMLRLGELVIAQKVPSLMTTIERPPCKPGERWERERILAGFDEGKITAEMARRWDFPTELTQALDASALPLQSPPFSRLGAVVHLAALMADTPEVSRLTLEALPLPVVQALQLNLPGLHASLPSAQVLSDISMLQA
jgi:HD-like signal output (HDOD) protein